MIIRNRFLLISLSFGLLFIHSHPAAAQQTTALTPRLPHYPLDVAVDDKGDAFVVDRNLPGVWHWQAGKLSKFYEGSPKYRTPLNAPRCILLAADGSLLVGDSATRDIYRLREGADPEPLTGGKIGIPMDLALASDGTLYVADLELRMLLRIPAGSQDVEQVVSINPRGIWIDGNDRVWVVSQNSQQLQIVDPDGTVEVVVKERIFEFPHQVVVDGEGTAYVSDGYRKAIWKVSPGKSPEILVEGDPLDNPVGLALKDQVLFVADPRARKIFQVNLTNGELESWFEVKD